METKDNKQIREEADGGCAGGASERKPGLTHFNAAGEAWMVDVGGKAVSAREAVASGRIYLSAECMERVMAGRMGKGDVLGTARIAGIMGAKQTSELIPLCHRLNLTKLELGFETRPEAGFIEARCTARCLGQTGVEMEALTGVSVALLTIYDMCKAVDRSMRLTEIRLEEKRGGKSGEYRRVE